MQFAKLYAENRQAVTRALASMWCGETGNDSQKATVGQLKEVINQLFAPEEAVPVVQCMNSYQSVHSVDAATAKATVGTLWKWSYPPYEHQYKSWKALLNEQSPEGKPLSICVTTGTGSGKTECFMMPLVHDLSQRAMQNQVQALFLYPLNALMEDQKERLEALLAGTGLTYTVYNGDLPEREPNATDFSPEAEKLRRKIDLIRGVERDEQGNILSVKFPKMLYTRHMVRHNPPNILLTNPTMLEYILLRGSDTSIINPAAHSLSWVAIDETHTYTGAGAAELAMLLRRVLLAFGVKATDVHFATSSATFGNADTPEKKKAEETKLRRFISGITGTSEEQVRVIDGVRQGEENLETVTDAADRVRWKMLFDQEYVTLNDLYPGEQSIEQKLILLDEMCNRVSDARFKAKVHYFYRVPNNGLFVRLTEHEEGAFKIYSTNSLNEKKENEAPLLELSRCKHCGEYVAVARVNQQDMTYEPLVGDDSDMFDLQEDDESEAQTKYAIFGLSAQANMRGDNNARFQVVGNQLSLAGQSDNEWHIVANLQKCCPYCNSKLTKSSEQDMESDAQGDMDARRLQKFRLSADFIARLIAPSVLDQLDPMLVQDKETGKWMPDPELLHGGQQFISFVDSRQTAARSTLKQNMEEERLWLYTTIFHELCKIKTQANQFAKQIAELRDLIRSDEASEEEMDEAYDEIKRLRSKSKGYLTWDEITKLLLENEYCSTFCNLFVKHSSDSEELEEDGRIKLSVKKQYVQSLMVMYLAHRPASAASPENLGLFHTCYPSIAKIKVPEEVKAFNELMTIKDNQISDKDWQHLIQLYMDYTVRNNQSLFLKLAESNPIDIMSSVRFAAEKPHRRMAKRPNTDNGHQHRIVRLLAALLARDKQITEQSALKTYKNAIHKVIDALWRTLTDSENQLLEYGQTFDRETHQWKMDRSEPDEPWRYNLHNLCFRLYEDVYLCDVNADTAERHVACYRPIENHFKGFSPYLVGGNSVQLQEALHEHWEVFPYFHESGKSVDLSGLENWAKEKRRLLWDYQLWNDNGIFAGRLNDIHLMPNLFIQGEHTAQVDKMTSRKRQEDFKAHKVNILACSTTMEMGVDLGNLEVVMLTSVPPQPSNYKQRAGRSGRNNKVRSACITLCGSDAIGLRTLYHPIEKIINRVVEVPTVDLKSPQVILRHVNSYLIRTFDVFRAGQKGGSLNQKVVDFYTPFRIEVDAEHKLRVYDGNNQAEPDKKLGNAAGTLYEMFRTKCDENLQALDPLLKSGLDELLSHTVFEGQYNYVLQKAKEANDRLYGELSVKLEDYAFAFLNSKPLRPKFRALLNMQYLEVLNDRLLNYWATNRFTPNANMPVNVLSLDLNTSGSKDFMTPSTSSNPSYSLREAIAQYAPGNSVVVDGVAFTVRGIQYTNQYQGINTFKQIYRNKEKTVINDGTSLSNKILWQSNGREALDLISPTGFIPDMNEPSSRIIDNTQYTRVSAQLIDADEWVNIVTEPHLYSMRSNRDTGNAKILYYNEGIGYGYCFCTRCGKMVLEEEAAESASNPEKLPTDMHDRRPRQTTEAQQTERPRFHLAISGKEAHKPCAGSYQRELIKRNVIIGDAIQTDYCEIRIRHKGKNHWISNRDDEQSLLFTLGIVFAQSLVDILGKDRNAVDFAITPNGHICIFDTNPGGAGYSNQLSNIQIMKDVVEAAHQILLQAKEKKSKDMLVDKFTLRFLKFIDIDAALAWMDEEHESCAKLPANIAEVFPTATETSLAQLVENFSHSFHESILFVNDELDHWDYHGVEHGWLGCIGNQFTNRGRQTSFCIIRNENQKATDLLNDVKSSISEWANSFIEIDNPYKDNGLYPLAYIDECLYFTNDATCASLNHHWGNGTMYCVRCTKFV